MPVGVWLAARPTCQCTAYIHCLDRWPNSGTWCRLCQKRLQERDRIPLLRTRSSRLKHSAERNTINLYRPLWLSIACRARRIERTIICATASQDVAGSSARSCRRTERANLVIRLVRTGIIQRNGTSLIRHAICFQNHDFTRTLASESATLPRLNSD